MITISDLHKSFGGKRVLRGITGEIADGEFVTVLGKNGAGKSTLLRSIALIAAPDRGRILVEGVPAGRES